MVDACNRQNYINIKYLFYICPETHYISSQQTVNQITARNAVVFLPPPSYLSLRKPQKHTQLQL